MPLRENSSSSMRLAVARWLYASRDHRPAAKFDDLYGEPAWDILLDLYIAEYSGKRTAVSSACLAARVPSTTALRYIKSLCAKGLTERLPDERDRRRLWLQLSPRALHEMDLYIDRSIDELRAIFKSSQHDASAQPFWDLRGSGKRAASNAA